MNRREAFLSMLGLPLATTITRVDAQELKPSDVIVLEVPGKISAETVQRIKDYAHHVFPDRQIVVLGDGMKLRVVSVE